MSEPRQLLNSILGDVVSRLKDSVIDKLWEIPASYSDAESIFRLQCVAMELRACAGLLQAAAQTINAGLSAVDKLRVLAGIKPDEAETLRRVLPEEWEIAPQLAEAEELMAAKAPDKKTARIRGGAE